MSLKKLSALIALALGLTVSSATALTTTINVGGKSYLFDSTSPTCKDQRDYIDPEGKFTQHNILCPRTDTPITVSFRQDATTGRLEEVFENFKMWGAANTAGANLGAWTAAITKPDGTTASMSGSLWWWGSRFRYNPTPRPFRHTAQELIAAKLLSNLAPTIPLKDPANYSSCAYTGPMSTSCITPDMSSTGERNDLGDEMDSTSQAILVMLSNPTPSADVLGAITGVAEGAGSLPEHQRDEQTGAPVDFLQYPHAQWYDKDSGQPYIYMAGQPLSATYPWFVNQAHMPSLAWVGWLMTGDPYYLEELQFMAQASIGWTGYYFDGANRLCSEAQTRGIAWGCLRDLVRAAKSAPVTPPSWLKSKAYFETLLTNYHTHFTNSNTLATDPMHTVFHTDVHPVSMAAWQEDFLAYEMGRAVELGYTAWLPDFKYTLGNAIARTNGTSGWPRQWCCEYFVTIGTGPFDGAGNPQPGFVPFTSWGQAWNQYIVANPQDATPLSDTVSYAHALTDGANYAYLVYARGALAMGVELGVTEASAPFAFVDSMVRNPNFGLMFGKWSVVPRGAVVTPPPPPPPPPVSTKFVIGARVQATVAVNVRRTPTTSSTTIGTELTGALGTVVGGPTAADGYNWWQIKYDNNLTGWSIETALVAAPVSPPPPPPPPPPTTTHHLVETLDGVVILDKTF